VTPKSVEEAVKLDHENGNTMWWDSILKEIKNVRPAFEDWEVKEQREPYLLDTKRLIAI
jgi:hypothetical protein